MGLLDSILSLITGVSTTSPSWTCMTDWGSYLTYLKQIQFDWDVLVPAGVKFFMTRGDQEQIDPEYGNYSTVINLEASREANVLVSGSYYWHYPNERQPYRIDRYSRAIERENPDVISIDSEQTSYYGSDGLWHAVDPHQGSDTLLELCDGLVTRFPEKPFLLYSRIDYLRTFCTYAVPYIDANYEFWMAGWPDYGATVYELALSDIISGKMKQMLTYNPVTTRWINVIKDGFKAPVLSANTKVRCWQTTSRAIPIYEGKSGAARHQYDFGFYLGSIDEMLVWAKKQSSGGGEVTPPPEVTMINTHDTTVPVMNRAFGVKVDIADPREDMAEIATAAKFVFLEIGGNDGQPGTGKEMYVGYPSYPIRSQRAVDSGVVPLAWWNSDPGYFLWKQMTMPQFTGQPLREREDLKAILTTLRKSTFDWDNLSASDGNWYPINGLVLCFYESMTHVGGEIPGVWHQAVLERLINSIVTLQQGGYVPKFPIYVYTNPPLLKLYSNEVGEPLINFLRNQIVSNAIAGIGYGWPLYPQVPTASALSMTQTSGYRYADEYEYGFTPDGFANKVKFFVYSWGLMLSKAVKESDGITFRTIATATWCNTPEKMYAELSVTEVVPPVIPPPEVETTILDRLKKISDDLDGVISDLGSE